MSSKVPRRILVLAGPTACGKSQVAHHLALQEGWPVLSADAMLVYRGMDIGTAKPSPDWRAQAVYGGIDCVTPDQPFSVGAWLEVARAFLAAQPRELPVLLVGGTGLYIKGLLQGLDPMPPVDPALRREVEALYAGQGLPGLQAACAALDPERYAALRDPANPRRLMRLWELARMGVPAARVWDRPSPIHGVGLEMERETLDQRIAQRVDAMYEGGLLEEVRRLQAAWPVWSATAGQAIGYREAVAVLAGGLTEAEARAETVRRTRRYARRQRTWFRHQLTLETVELSAADPVEAVVDRVRAGWRVNGPNRYND